MDPEYINRELSHYDEEERDARSVYPTGLSASLLLVMYGGYQGAQAQRFSLAAPTDLAA